MTSWGEKYVDESIERAWLALRLQLADRLADALAAEDTRPIPFTAPGGGTITVLVDGGQVVILDGDSAEITDNVDEAAYTVYEILREDWEVIHPAFLDSPLVDAPDIDDHPAGTTDPTLGTAESQEVLQAWVEATLQEITDETLRVAPDGSVAWRTHGSPVIVRVRDRHWIEIWVALAWDVDAETARRLAHRLSRRHVAINFARRDGALIASRMVDAGPFAPRHVKDALRLHLQLAEELRWVQREARRMSGRDRKKGRRKGAKARRPVPPELVALLPSANRISSAALADEVRDRAGGDRSVLEAWREVARAEWVAVRRSRRDDDPDQVIRRLGSAWLRLSRAIDAALEQGKRREAA
jgi:hypothetical protein